MLDYHCRLQSENGPSGHDLVEISTDVGMTDLLTLPFPPVRTALAIFISFSIFIYFQTPNPTKSEARHNRNTSLQNCREMASAELSLSYSSFTAHYLQKSLRTFHTIPMVRFQNLVTLTHKFSNPPPYPLTQILLISPSLPTL